MHVGPKEAFYKEVATKLDCSLMKAAWLNWVNLVNCLMAKMDLEMCTVGEWFKNGDGAFLCTGS